MDDAPKPYSITIRPEPGQMFVIKHFGKWYRQDANDQFYGPYESDLSAILEENPTNGRALDELPV